MLSDNVANVQLPSFNLQVTVFRFLWCAWSNNLFEQNRKKNIWRIWCLPLTFIYSMKNWMLSHSACIPKSLKQLEEGLFYPSLSMRTAENLANSFSNEARYWDFSCWCFFFLMTGPLQHSILAGFGVFFGRFSFLSHLILQVSFSIMKVLYPKQACLKLSGFTKTFLRYSI